MKLNFKLKTVFWDFAVSDLDFTKHSRFIISRILEKGDFDLIKWLFSTYTESEIINTVQSSSNLSTQTINLWKMVLLPHEKAL